MIFFENINDIYMKQIKGYKGYNLSIILKMQQNLDVCYKIKLMMK